MSEIIISGAICSITYFVVCFARNILSVVTPSMISAGYSTEYIGVLSTVFMLTYAGGQLVNGMIGDRIKPKYMISMGMLIAAGGLVCFLGMDAGNTQVVMYGASGYALSMIYAPMTREIAESTDLTNATRILLSLALAALVASPAAGLAAMFLEWQTMFLMGIVLLVIMGWISWLTLTNLEKHILQYRCDREPLNLIKKNVVSKLLKNGIVHYTFVSMFTGIIRTSVMFWIPTLLVQYMGYSARCASGLYSAVTLIGAFSPCVGVWIYRQIFESNIDRTMIYGFLSGALCFLLMCIFPSKVIGIILLVMALLSGNIVSTMLWNVYCPSLKKTGLVSTATGYLDFVSYIGGAIANVFSANIASTIGWDKLLVVWAVFMGMGAMFGCYWKRCRKQNNKTPL